MGKILYTDYIVGGTVTGRRAAKGFPLGFGLNGQNLPKHSKLGKQYRKCVIARPGKILLQCDQVSAEDWLVQGIIADVSGDESGVNDLKSGVDRHCKLAMFIFSLPETDCNKAAEGEGKIFRYIGKRTRHAGNYDMRENTFAMVLAKEGYSVPVAHCENLLNRFHIKEPNIRGVFHEFVKREITNNRRLVNLFGRPRDFFGFCPWRDNGNIFREGYAQIPQGTVGDNTGHAFQYCERKRPGLAVQESHDSLILELDDTIEEVFAGVQLLTKAFDRVLRFQHGYELQIPIEFELGYSQGTLTRCANLSRTGLLNTLTGLRQSANRQPITTSGLQPVLWQPA